MRKITGWLACSTVITLLASFAAGCAQPTPEERVAAMRARYTAELQGFVIRTEPLVDETAAGDEEVAAADSAAGGGEDGSEEAAPVPVQQNLLLDIVVRNENKERLPGLTLDVSQQGADGADKAHWQIWVDTAKIGRGPGTAVNHLIEDIDYTEGDGFNVEVRAPVPAAERADYREFSAAS